MPSNGRRSSTTAPQQSRIVRCAIYTRTSTDEGLAQEFNSLDAQRETAEAYIASQRHAGWTVLPDTYDDGGFSGGDMDRPALQRLLQDVKSGKIECVLVSKVDRLSRSIVDFARITEVFESRGVSLVCVTQQFNTSTLVGRFTLNILLTFAQFEREMIGERTRDKMSAARRKGKWIGGIPVLGYDVDPGGGKLAVNIEEATRVRAIFELYAEFRGLIPVVSALNARRWMTKTWTTHEGRLHPGRPFTKNALFRLLTNVQYTGRIRHKGELYPGEQPAIVDASLWQKVQEILGQNGPSKGRERGNRYGAMLKGILHCASCGSSMLPTYTVQHGRRYRYYECRTVQQRGRQACETKSVNANRIEQSILERIRGLAADPEVATETWRRVQEEQRNRNGELRRAIETQRRESKRVEKALRRAATAAGQGPRQGDRVMELEKSAASQKENLKRLSAELAEAEGQVLTESEIQSALRTFDPVWASLTSQEQTTVIRSLIERIEYHGPSGRISVEFRSDGIKALSGRQRGEHTHAK